MILQVGSLDSSISIIQERAGNINSQDHSRPLNQTCCRRAKRSGLMVGVGKVYGFHSTDEEN